jgi:hypothetical protein
MYRVTVSFRNVITLQQDILPRTIANNDDYNYVFIVYPLLFTPPFVCHRSIDFRHSLLLRYR